MTKMSAISIKPDFARWISSPSSGMSTTTTVSATSAKTGDGIATLCGAIDGHHAYLVGSGELARRRQRATKAEVIRLLQSRLTASILRALETPQAQNILSAVAERKLDPYDAVEKLSLEIQGK